MQLRVMAIDGGLNVGFAVFGAGAGNPPAAGSYRLRGNASARLGEAMAHFEELFLRLLEEHSPSVVVFAAPFIGRMAAPENLAPLFGCKAEVEKQCFRRGIRCVEINEPAARRMFLNNVPRKTKDIKRAVIDACKQRGWHCPDDHAADAIVVAAHALELLDESTAYRTTPLFAVEKPKRKSRKKPCLST